MKKILALVVFAFALISSNVYAAWQQFKCNDVTVFGVVYKGYGCGISTIDKRTFDEFRIYDESNLPKTITLDKNVLFGHVTFFPPEEKFNLGTEESFYFITEEDCISDRKKSNGNNILYYSGNVDGPGREAKGRWGNASDGKDLSDTEYIAEAVCNLHYPDKNNLPKISVRKERPAPPPSKYNVASAPMPMAAASTPTTTTAPSAPAAATTPNTKYPYWKQFDCPINGVVNKCSILYDGKNRQVEQITTVNPRNNHYYDHKFTYITAEIKVNTDASRVLAMQKSQCNATSGSFSMFRLNPKLKGYEDMELPGENRRTGNVKYWAEAVKNELCKKHQLDVAAGLTPSAPSVAATPTKSSWKTFDCYLQSKQAHCEINSSIKIDHPRIATSTGIIEGKHLLSDFKVNNASFVFAVADKNCNLRAHDEWKIYQYIPNKKNFIVVAEGVFSGQPYNALNWGAMVMRELCTQHYPPKNDFFRKDY